MVESGWFFPFLVSKYDARRGLPICLCSLSNQEQGSDCRHLPTNTSYSMDVWELLEKFKYVNKGDVYSAKKTGNWTSYIKLGVKLLNLEMLFFLGLVNGENW